MSPAHLSGFTEDGKSQLRRVLERAIAQRPDCHAKCSYRADGLHGFCQACWDTLPPVLAQAISATDGLRRITAMRTAAEWLRGILEEQASE